MKPVSIAAIVVAALVIAAGIYFVDIDQTEEARLPEVSVEGGNMPEFEAKTGDIEVGSKEVEVTVPTVNVQTPEEEAAETGTLETEEESAEVETEETEDRVANN